MKISLRWRQELELEGLSFDLNIRVDIARAENSDLGKDLPEPQTSKIELSTKSQLKVKLKVAMTTGEQVKPGQELV